MAKQKLLPLPPSPEVREEVLKAVRAADEPLAARSLAKLVPAHHKLAEKGLAPILEELVAAGKLCKIPPATAKGKPRYWHKGAIEYGRAAVLNALELKGPQTATTLKKAPKGLDEFQRQEVFEGLIAERALFIHPPIGKSKKELFGNKPPSPEPYLKDVGAQLTKIVEKLLTADVSRQELRRAMVQLAEAAGIPFAAGDSRDGTCLTGQTPAFDLVALIKRIEPGAERGALVSSRDVRRAARLGKQQFDRAVLELAREGRLSLHRHDYVASLSQSERDELVDDGSGTYYVGMALRRIEE